jgi:hypothetical protein
MKRKKMMILIVVLIILMGGIVSIIVLNANNMNKASDQSIPNTLYTSPTNNEQEEHTNEITKTEESLSTEQKESENQIKTKPKTTSTTIKTPTTSKTTKPKTTSQSSNNTKGICNSSNQGWMEYIAAWKKRNSTSMVFDTLNQAIAYGEYAAKQYGYGYWRSQEPQTFDGTYYEDSECSKGFYTVRLYVPSLTCGINNEYNYKMFYIQATAKENLIDIITYVTQKKGYKCEDRKWVPIS